MRDRRQTPHVSSPTYSKVMEVVSKANEEQDQRADSAFTRVFKILSDIQMDVRQGNFERQHLLSRMAELEMQIGETRAQVALIDQRTIEGAAKGAAAGATEGAATAAAQVASETAASVKHNFWRSWRGRVTVWATAFTAVVVAIKNLPPVLRESVRVVVGVYTFIVGHNPPSSGH